MIKILLFMLGALVGMISMSCFAANNYKRGERDAKFEIKKYLTRIQSMSKHFNNKANFYKKRISYLIEILERGNKK